MAFPFNPSQSTTARKQAPDVGAILLKAKNVGVDPVHLDALKRAAKGGKVERDELSAALDAMEEHGTDPGDIDLVRQLCNTKLPKRPAHVEAPPGSPVPRGFVEACDSEEAVAIMVASRAGGRLRHVAESGEWLIFAAPAGWAPVAAAVIEETLTDCARANIGHVEKKTGFLPRPSSSGRRSVGRNIAGLLTGRVEVASKSADWDAAPNMIMLPDGTLLDLVHRRAAAVECRRADTAARAGRPRPGCRVQPVKVPGRARACRTRPNRARVPATPARCGPGGP